MGFMIEVQCHCGNISLEISELPAQITSCNCSICNRLGALWAYYPPGKVAVSCKKEPTSVYIWGDKLLEFHHCTICGCATHYTVTGKYVEEYKKERIAVNCRMMNADIIQSIPLRKFDGAAL